MSRLGRGGRYGAAYLDAVSRRSRAALPPTLATCKATTPNGSLTRGCVSPADHVGKPGLDGWHRESSGVRWDDAGRTFDPDFSVSANDERAAEGARRHCINAWGPRGTVCSDQSCPVCRPARGESR